MSRLSRPREVSSSRRYGWFRVSPATSRVELRHPRRTASCSSATRTDSCASERGTDSCASELALGLPWTVTFSSNGMLDPSRRWKLTVRRPPQLELQRWMKWGHNMPADFDMLTFYNPWDDADLGTRPKGPEKWVVLLLIRSIETARTPSSTARTVSAGLSNFRCCVKGSMPPATAQNESPVVHKLCRRKRKLA